MINKGLYGEKPKPKISLPFLDPLYKPNLNLVKKYFYLLNSLESWESREGDQNCIQLLNSPNTHCDLGVRVAGLGDPRLQRTPSRLPNFFPSIGYGLVSKLRS